MRKIQKSVGGFWVFNYFLYERWIGVPDTWEKFELGLNCIPIFMELEKTWQ